MSYVSFPQLLRAAAVTAATVMTTATLLTPRAAADDSFSDQCTFPSKQVYSGRPWALQRVNLDELWSQSQGKNVRVAVIDTGVDVKNPQLAHSVDVKSGRNFLPLKDSKGKRI